MRNLLVTLVVLLLFAAISIPATANPVAVEDWDFFQEDDPSYTSPPGYDYSYSNQPVKTWGFIEGTDVYFRTAGQRFGALLLFILLESIIIMSVAQIPFRTSLGISAAMNLLSTLAGFIIRDPGIFVNWGWVLLPILLIASTPLLLKMKIQPGYAMLAAYSIIAGVIMLVLNTNVDLPSKEAYIPRLLIPLLLPFGLALVVEPLAAGFMMDRARLWKSVLIANAASYIMMVLMILASSPGMDTYQRVYGNRYMSNPVVMELDRSDIRNYSLPEVLYFNDFQPSLSNGALG